MRLRLFLIAVLLAGSLFGKLTSEQRGRVDRLEHRLLAPCCYSEMVADHHSAVATQMREEIPRMVASGQTNRQILDHYIAKYGERVLVEPEGRLWWWMNVIPIVAIGLGLIIAVFVLRRWRKTLPGGHS